MNNKHLYVLCAVLTVIGVTITAYRAVVLEFPLTPRENVETWRIETKIGFEGRGGPTKVSLMLPQSIPGLTILDERFLAPEYGAATSSPDANRRVVFSKKESRGQQVIYYRAVVHRAQSTESPARTSSPRLQRARYQSAEKAAAQVLVKEIDAVSADDETFVRLLFARLRDPRGAGPVRVLLGSNPTDEKRAQVAVNILAEARKPARTVHGLSLTPDRRNARLSHWIEVFDDGLWRPFDPASGEFVLPADHFPWWRGGDKLVALEGGQDLHVDLAVQRSFVPSLDSALSRGRQRDAGLIAFSVFGLPLQTQEVYRLLLTIPIGIFLLVVLRNVVGVKTFGTFMPVLIALAFRETQLVWGLVLFSVVVAVGLLVRFYLEQLKLLLVPRLAAVVIVVVLAMTLISILSYKLGFDRGLSVALFPIVILSMTIERMTIVWDERGPKEALTQAAGSLVVAVLCYLVMTLGIVRHFVFVFPESILVLLAAVLLLGRYSGYRLVELPRFKVLAGERR